MANEEHYKVAEEAIDYTFEDHSILEEALKQSQNKRLGFLGDKVVALMLIDSWYRSGKSCGDGNFRLQHYGSNKEMARQARRIHVDNIVELHSLSQADLLQSPHALATDIEAIVGAVWIDSRRDFDAVERVMRRLHIYPE